MLAITRRRLFVDGFSRVSVLGAGLMGSGIATVSLMAGRSVTMCDVSEAAAEAGRKRVEKNVGWLLDKESKNFPGISSPTDVLSRLQLSSSFKDGVAQSQLVIEAVPENLALKCDLFADIDAVAPEESVFCTNTSSLSVTELAAAVSPARRNRFAGLHFFSPVHRMKLVEVVSTMDVSKSTTERLVEYCKAIGKAPVTCGDTPGFIVNRLLVPAICMAIQMVERGDASPEDIDLAMKLGASHPMGPLTLADFVGLDVMQFVLAGWAEKHPEMGWSPPPVRAAAATMMPLLLAPSVTSPLISCSRRWLPKASWVARAAKAFTNTHDEPYHCIA